MGIGCFVCEAEVVEVPPRNCVRINHAAQALPPGDHSPTKVVICSYSCNSFTNFVARPEGKACLTEVNVCPIFSCHSRGTMMSYVCVSHGYRGGVRNGHTDYNLKSVSLGIIRESHIHANHLCMTHRIHGSEILFL